MGKSGLLESFSRSGTGMRTALLVARAVPRRMAEGVIDFAAMRFMASSAALGDAARLNQWMASGRTLCGEALDRAVRENVRMMGRFLYDFYHVLGSDEAEEGLVVFDDVADEFLRRHLADGPFIYAIAHFGNFDLMGRVLGRHGLSAQLLSVADPNAGYEWQNAVRQQPGMEVTPVSIESLKQAARGLANGRSVITGLDRPLLQPDKIQPRLFGHDAPLPLLHVRLAMRVRVPVVVVTAPRTEDGRYRLLTSAPIEMVGDSPPPEALRVNAERCLAEAERMILTDPRQWAMPHRVWPDLALPAHASDEATPASADCSG